MSKYWNKVLRCSTYEILSFYWWTISGDHKLQLRPRASINFNREVEALASLRFQVQRGAVVTRSTSDDLSVPLALWELVDDSNAGDGSVVLLLWEWERHVLSHYSHPWRRLVADGVRQQDIVSPNETEGRVVAGGDGNQSQESQTNEQFHDFYSLESFYRNKLKVTDDRTANWSPFYFKQNIFIRQAKQTNNHVDTSSDKFIIRGWLTHFLEMNLICRLVSCKEATSALLSTSRREIVWSFLKVLSLNGKAFDCCKCM